MRVCVFLEFNYPCLCYLCLDREYIPSILSNLYPQFWFHLDLYAALNLFTNAHLISAHVNYICTISGCAPVSFQFHHWFHIYIHMCDLNLYAHHHVISVWVIYIYIIAGYAPASFLFILWFSSAYIHMWFKPDCSHLCNLCSVYHMYVCHFNYGPASFEVLFCLLMHV